MNDLKITLDNLKPSKMDIKAKQEAQQRIQQRAALHILDNNKIDLDAAKSFVDYQHNNNYNTIST